MTHPSVRSRMLHPIRALRTTRSVPKHEGDMSARSRLVIGLERPSVRRLHICLTFFRKTVKVCISILCGDDSISIAPDTRFVRLTCAPGRRRDCLRFIRLTSAVPKHQLDLDYDCANLRIIRITCLSRRCDYPSWDQLL